MTDRKDVTKSESESVQDTKRAEPAIRPPVDIYEDETGITVQADMPGVAKDRLNLHIENDALSIEGETVIPMPPNMEAIHADVRSTHYRRSFSLSKELDTERIEANLKDGVLTVRIPKRAEHQRRKIEVRSE